MLPATADLLDRLAPRFVTVHDAVRHMTRQGYVFHRPTLTFARPGIAWRLAPTVTPDCSRAHRLLLKRT